MFNSRSEAMLWVVSMVLMAGGGALGYLVTGSPWAWAIGGLVLAIVLRIVLALTVDARSGRVGSTWAARSGPRASDPPSVAAVDDMRERCGVDCLPP